MMRYEILDGDTVINTIEASAEFVETHYSGMYREAAEQAVPSAQTYGTKITTDALYRRMTAAERRRIELKSIDPGVDGPLRDLAADLRIGKARLSGAAYFDLELPENIAQITGMGLAGLLDPPQHGGATRAAEILASPVTDHNELPGALRVAYGLPEVPL